MSKRPLPWFILGVAIFLSSLLFTPAGAAVFVPGDVQLHLLNASRMLEGQAIYRDFFQFTTPGSELVYLVLFRLCGPRAWIPNVTLIVLGLALVWLSIVISRKLMWGRTVFLPGLLFATIPFFHGLDPSHNWFSVLIIMIAAAFVMERRAPRRMAVVGMLCGLAAFFTQTRGLLAYIGFAVFLAWERRRNGRDRRSFLEGEAFLAAAFFSTVLATNAYFIWNTALSRYVDLTVTFIVRYYPAFTPSTTLKSYLLSPPNFRPWHGLTWVVQYLLVHILVPGAYLLFTVRYWKEAHRQPQYPWDRLMLVNITGFFLFLSVAPAPSYFRLCVVSLPAVILLVWFSTIPKKPEQVLACLFWILVPLMATADILHVQRHASSYIDLPSGRTVFLEPISYLRFEWLSRHTRPADYFLEASWANTYVALGLRNPTPVPFVTNCDYTRPEQVRAVVEALESRRVRLVLWSLEVEPPQNASGVGDHLGPLRTDLHSHYHVIKSFADGEQVWERNE
jgi:hypothetical protein